MVAPIQQCETPCVANHALVHIVVFDPLFFGGRRRRHHEDAPAAASTSTATSNAVARSEHGVQRAASGLLLTRVAIAVRQVEIVRA